MSSSTKNIITFLILFLARCTLSAQDYHLTHFNEESGFKANTVYGIAKDKKGFYWFGTVSGLIRYDGVTFKKYYLDDGLSDLEIFSLSVDSSNHIFLHNYMNQPNFYFEDRFYNARNDSNLAKINFTEATLNNYSKHNNTFFLTESRSNHFYSFKLVDAEVEQLNFYELDDHSEIIAINSIDDTQIIFFMDTLRKSHYRIYQNGIVLNQSEFPYSVNASAIVSTEKRLILSPRNEGKYYNHILFYELNNKFELEQKSEREIAYAIKGLFEFNGTLWATLLDGGVLEVKPDSTNEILLEGKDVNTILVEENSNMWIGTAGDGMYHYRSLEIDNIGPEMLGINANVKRLALGADGSMYAGFNRLAISKLKDNKLERKFNLFNKDVPAAREIRYIEEINPDTLLVATDDNLIKFNINGKNTKYKIFDRSGAIKDVSSYKDNEYWLGQSNGISIVNNNGLTESAFRIRTLSLKFDESKTLWIGTLRGLYFKIHDSDVFEKLALPAVASMKINDIEIDKKRIFLATDSGVCIINNSDSPEPKFVTTSEGLTNNQCNKLTVYKNTLWASTSDGASKISLDLNNDSELLGIQNYNKNHGLHSNYVNDIKVKNDTAWIATNKGISPFPISFTPSFERGTPTIIDAKSQLDELNIYQDLELEPRNNSISIAFSDMIYRNTQGAHFAYRLLPVDQNWSMTSEHVVTFSELQPEDYTFEVKLVNADGARSAHSDTLDFKVKARFYQTLLFKILAALIAAGLIYLFFKNRERVNQKKLIFEKTISQLELEAIKAQINPHFIYNCLNSIKATIVKKETLKAEEQLNTFTKLVRQTLNLSQFNYISIEDEVEYLKNYLQMEKIRFKEKLEYNIDTSKIEDMTNIEIPSMIIQPYVENSIKHGMPEDESLNALINIIFSNHGEDIVCRILDNGPGIYKTLANKETTHVSQGMRITSERTKKLNNIFNTEIEILAQEREEGGTQITLTMPQRM